LFVAQSVARMQSQTVIHGSPRSKLSAVFRPPEFGVAPGPTGMSLQCGKMSPRAQTALGSPRAHTSLEAQSRIVHNRQRDQLKAIMQTVSGSNGEISNADLLLSAKLAKIDLPEEFLLRSPYAHKYASGWDSTSNSPRAIKWQPFYEAIDYTKVQPASTEAFLQRHADKLAAKAAKATKAAKLAADEAAARAAAPAVAAAAKAAAMGPFVSEDELRKAHSVIKGRLTTQFGELRTAFRALDRDGSGRITHAEAEGALETLNLGVPKRILGRIVDVADFDGDGEITFAEFARVLTADDIMSMKASVQAAYTGTKVIDSSTVARSVVKAPEMFKNGVTKDEIRGACAAIKEKMVHKYMRLDTAFKSIDEDRSGYLTHSEFRFFLKVLNLDLLDEKIVQCLIEIMDADNDGQINHQEFTHLLSADDPLNAGPLAAKVEKKIKRHY